MVSLDIETINPSILPLASISMLITSFEKDSFDKPTITLYPLSFAYCSTPLITLVKKWCTISGIIIPIVFVFLFFKLKAILLGR